MKKQVNTYKVVNNETDNVLYITCIYENALDWLDFYQKNLGLDCRIDSYEY